MANESRYLKTTLEVPGSSVEEYFQQISGIFTVQGVDASWIGSISPRPVFFTPIILTTHNSKN
jgi:hypothetical protein